MQKNYYYYYIIIYDVSLECLHPVLYASTFKVLFCTMLNFDLLIQKSDEVTIDPKCITAVNLVTKTHLTFLLAICKTNSTQILHTLGCLMFVCHTELRYKIYD